MSDTSPGCRARVTRPSLRTRTQPLGLITNLREYQTTAALYGWTGA